MGFYSVHLTGVKCVATESSVDSKTIGAVSNLAKNYFDAGSEIMGKIEHPVAKVFEAVTKIEAKIANSLPELLGSIASDRNDPDQLYIAIGNDPGIAVWPTPGKAKDNYEPLRSGQEWIGQPKTKITFLHIEDDRPVVFSLWEYDSGSRDDFLGSFKVTPDQMGQRVGQLVVGTVEKSIYIVEYEVHKETEKVDPKYKQAFDKFTNMFKK